MGEVPTPAVLLEVDALFLRQWRLSEATSPLVDADRLAQAAPLSLRELSKVHLFDSMMPGVYGLGGAWRRLISAFRAATPACYGQKGFMSFRSAITKRVAAALRSSGADSFPQTVPAKLGTEPAAPDGGRDSALDKLRAAVRNERAWADTTSR
jgi:hypothetical protein